MINILNGNLLESNCNIIAHCCNCQGAFGSGFAGQVAKKYPIVKEFFQADRRDATEKLGDLCWVPVEKNLIFMNLYGQLFYGYDGKLYVDYKALEKSLTKMFNIIPEISRIKKIEPKIGMPYMMACGLAGGDWNVVSEIIDNVSKDTVVNVYKWDGRWKK